MKKLAIFIALGLTIGSLSCKAWLATGFFAIVAIVLYYSDFDDEWGD